MQYPETPGRKEAQGGDTGFTTAQRAGRGADWKSQFRPRARLNSAVAGLLCFGLIAGAWPTPGGADNRAATEIAGPAPDTPKSRERASRVLQRAIDAQGGLESLLAVRDLRMVGVERKAQNPDAPWELEVLWRSPGFFRETLRRREPRPVEVVYTWDGRVGWASGFGQIQPDPSVEQRLRDFSWTRVDTLYARWQSGELVLLEWGKFADEAGKWIVLLASTTDQRERRYLLFDRRSGRLGRIQFESGRIAGFGRESTWIALSDWREVAIHGPGQDSAGSVWWPHGMRESTKNRALQNLVREWRFDSIDANSGLSESHFSRPGGR